MTLDDDGLDSPLGKILLAAEEEGMTGGMV